MHAIEINDKVYETAKRIADLDGIDVQSLIESLVRRHAEYIDVFQDSSPDTPFSLKR
jgi:hypothetical protein